MNWVLQELGFKSFSFCIIHAAYSKPSTLQVIKSSGYFLKRDFALLTASITILFQLLLICKKKKYLIFTNKNKFNTRKNIKL